MLELKNINKSFNDTEVLKDINFSVKKGEIVSLLGLSGSGKSTILNIISGFEQSDNGEVVYKDKIIADEKSFTQPQERGIGFVFQNYALFPHLNIYENITFGISKMPKEQKEKIAADLLKLISMEGFEKRYPHELSGGQQQRIALVRTMALNPELILLDEPFSSIDTMAKESIQRELLKILKGSSKTAIIVTHDASEAMAMSDKIIYLEKGKIVQCDTPGNIYNYPKSKLIAKAFGKANFIIKDDIEYCIRPKYCSLDKNKGEIKSKIVSVTDYGSQKHIKVSFRYQSESYEFLIVDNIMNTEYKSDETVYLNIDFSKGVKLV